MPRIPNSFGKDWVAVENGLGKKVMSYQGGGVLFLGWMSKSVSIDINARSLSVIWTEKSISLCVELRWVTKVRRVCMSGLVSSKEWVRKRARSLGASALGGCPEFLLRTWGTKMLDPL